MPELVSRVVDWFQARSTVQKALIVIGGLVLLAVLSPAAVLIAAVVLLISLVVLGLRMIYRGPLQGPAIIAAVSLVAVGLFSGISSAIYGGDQPQDTTDVERIEEPIADPEPEEPDPGQEPIADPEPEEQQEPEPEPERGLEPIVVPGSVDYRVVRQTSNDVRGLSVRTWLVDSEDDSPGALCAIAQDAALDAGEGWDVVHVVSRAGGAYVRMSEAAPEYSDLEGFEECPVPGEIFITR